MIWNQTTKVQILLPLLSGCVTLDKSLNSLGPYVLIYEMGIIILPILRADIQLIYTCVAFVETLKCFHTNW